MEKENEVFEYLNLNKIETDGTSNTWSDNVKMNGINVEIKLDTGAQLNVMPIELYKRINLARSFRSDTVVRSFSSTFVLPFHLFSQIRF